LRDKPPTGQTKRYEITIDGRIGDEWAVWFDGMTIAPCPGGRTMLTGPVVDQAALYGLLCKIHNLGLPLVSVRRLTEMERDGGV
jgi:hypothetical protein